MAHVIGIDGGTESLRAFVFDLEGKPRGSHAVTYETRFPEPSWAEQDPETWWAALGGAVQGALANAGIGAGRIIGLAVDTTCCSVVALDSAGKPLRPAMIWMDVRASAEADSVAATGDPGLRVNGGGAGPVSAEWMLPKALWIKRNQPGLYDRAAMIGEYQDFLNLRLTGSWTGALTNMAARWHYQTAHGGVQHALLEAAGINDLAEKWPGRVLAPGTVIGGLTREAAAHLGLAPEVPVVQGGSDAFIGMIGLGVTQPGEMALITGSSHLQLGIAARAVHRPGVWGTYADAVYPGKPVIEGGQTSTGSMIAWMKRMLGPDVPYAVLNTEAEAVVPGAEGLVILDHFQGNRTPFTDPRSRGAITGLTLKHGRGHLFRATMEGICFGTRQIIESFGDAFTAERIVVAGGATRSSLWLQIHADTAGVPLQLTEVPDAPALGCAILAAHGVGRFASIEEGCAAMVRVTGTIEPDAARMRLYDDLYPAYRDLYAALRAARDTGQDEL